ncbi:MAG TPA: hypothetical protein VFZ61_10570 [Polyangiales bacterium]
MVETLISLPGAVAPVTSIRSTLIQSSLNTLRKRGHFERYLLHLDPRHRPTLLETLAPEWLPIEVASAHYAACDALGLSAGELLEIGEDVGARIQGTFIATLVRKARTVGLTPWVPLGQFQRLWERLIQGGAVGLSKLGPKDCSVDVRLLPLCEYAYFRAAFCGVVASGIKLGAGRSVHVREQGINAFAQRCVLKAAWV